MLWLVVFLLDFALRPKIVLASFFQVDSCAPDLGVDWSNWLPSQALNSTRRAMHLAKDYLGIELVRF